MTRQRLISRANQGTLLDQGCCAGLRVGGSIRVRPITSVIFNMIVMNKECYLFLSFVLLAIMPLGSSAQTLIGDYIDGNEPETYSGFSISLSDDGETIAVGTPDFNLNGTNPGFGQVRVYRIVNNTWQQVGQTIQGEEGADILGHSVSLSQDGNVLAIGIPGKDITPNNVVGQVKVYELSGNTWSLKGNPINGQNSSDYFGYSVAISANGQILAVGATQITASSNNPGYVSVFELVGNQWIQLGGDIAGEAVSDRFGHSIDISGDGSRFISGAIRNMSDRGHARVFEFNGVNWTKLGQDIDGSEINEILGNSVSISQDGNVIAIGSSLGASTYRYENAVGWIQMGEEIASDFSGNSVSISAQGDILAIGARNGITVDNVFYPGDTHVLKFSDNTWDALMNFDALGGTLSGGGDICITPDGARLATSDQAFNLEAGRVAVFDISDLLNSNNTLSHYFQRPSIFPNPVEDHAFIRTSNPNEEIQWVYVTTNAGTTQSVSGQGENIFSLHDQPNGVLFLIIETNYGKYCEKIVKTRK